MSCDSHPDLDRESAELSDIEGDEDDEYEIEIPVYHIKQLTEVVDDGMSSACKRPHILERILSSPDLSSTLDRINLSDQKFTMLAATIARAIEEDLQSASLSRSTIHCKRIEHRSSTDNNIRLAFLSGERSPLVIHWDGKMMKDSTNFENPKCNVDRIAVTVTGLHLEKILGSSLGEDTWNSEDSIRHWASTSQCNIPISQNVGCC